jgi:hypothetical protein
MEELIDFAKRIEQEKKETELNEYIQNAWKKYGTKDKIN